MKSLSCLIYWSFKVSNIKTSYYQAIRTCKLQCLSSFGLWFGAYAESLVDDMELLAAAYRIANKNPLGSGAGYGSSSLRP
jgi:hypothetical protein